MRKGNIISFNIVKIHFALKTPSLPMKQSVTNLWEDLKILQVFEFSVGFLVVWGQVFFGGGDGVAICWRRIVLRKYIKQETSKFSKTISAPLLPSGLSIQASQVLDYPSTFMVVVGPSPFRLFLQTGTQNHWDPKSHAHITKHGTGKCVTFRQQLIPHGLKTFFPMLWPSLSVSFQDCFQLWNFLFYTNLWKEGKEMPFNSNFKMFYFQLIFQTLHQVSCCFLFFLSIHWLEIKNSEFTYKQTI